MSRWISITKAGLYDTKLSALIDAADSVSLGSGQTDRSTGIIADVVAEIRRKVGKSNQLDQDTTKIPGGLKALAEDIIVARLKISIEQELSTDERNNLTRRENDLNRIADGKDQVEAPDNPIAANMVNATSNPSFGTRCRNFTDRSQDG